METHVVTEQRRSENMGEMEEHPDTATTTIFSGISRLRPGIQWSLSDDTPLGGGSHDMYKIA